VIILLQSEYNDLIDDIYHRIEDQVDELTQDLDVDFSGSVLTITFPNSSQVILSRQVATHEIWVAAKSGGFHLHLTEGQWVCGTTAENLPTLLSRTFTEQLGESVTLLV
jgi:CyaY protein